MQERRSEDVANHTNLGPVHWRAGYRAAKSRIPRESFPTPFGACFPLADDPAFRLAAPPWAEFLRRFAARRTISASALALGAVAVETLKLMVSDGTGCS
jgi:hypothetical protein